MTTVYLVRHGETDWNAEKRMQGQTDIPLNQKGIAQAEVCGASLVASDYDVVLSSGLQRAKKTAEIINGYLNLPFDVMDDFAERFFGDGEGLTIEERAKLYPDFNYPNQEELAVFAKRIMTGLQKVHEKYAGKRVLLVAHGQVIYRILRIVSKDQVDFGKRKIENTSISTIAWENGDWVLKDWNRVDHLKQVEKA
jgi:uncharacterized phosphatase